MPSIQRALIVGGGIGGLSVAIALSRQGVSVDIVEINAEPRIYHVGIGVRGNFVRALDALGLSSQAIDVGCAYSGSTFCDLDGNVIQKIPDTLSLGPQYPANLGITRPALHKVLLTGVADTPARLRFGVTFARIDDRDHDVHVEFTDGSSENYDLVIGADGIYSKVRDVLFGSHLKPTFTGQGVWRYNLPRDPNVDCSVIVKGMKGGSAGFVPGFPNILWLAKCAGDSRSAGDSSELLEIELPCRNWLCIVLSKRF